MLCAATMLKTIEGNGEKLFSFNFLHLVWDLIHASFDNFISQSQSRKNNFFFVGF